MDRDVFDYSLGVEPLMPAYGRRYTTFNEAQVALDDDLDFHCNSPSRGYINRQELLEQGVTEVAFCDGIYPVQMGESIKLKVRVHDLDLFDAATGVLYGEPGANATFDRLRRQRATPNL